MRGPRRALPYTERRGIGEGGWKQWGNRLLACLQGTVLCESPECVKPTLKGWAK